MMKPLSAAICVMLVLLLAPVVAPAKDGVLLTEPEVVVYKNGPNESVSVTGAGYRDFVAGAKEATFFVEQGPAEANTYFVRGGRIGRVTLAPTTDGCKVTLSYRGEPSYSVINAVPHTEWRPGVAQVVAGLGFTADSEGHGYPVMGQGRSNQPDGEGDQYGTYKLPKYPEPKYSDARVTLKVMNTDFRDVLWLLSDVGNVSIMLDPYWDQEPTGTQRPPGGGASGGSPGGSGGDGFRGADSFNPVVPREGTGRLSLDFKDVPFDLALDLVLQAVGLVKVDIWPEQ